jgi:hypothetical protein
MRPSPKAAKRRILEEEDVVRVASTEGGDEEEAEGVDEAATKADQVSLFISKTRYKTVNHFCINLSYVFPKSRISSVF